MCVKVNKYAEIIDVLQNDIYPSMNLLLDNLSSNSIVNDLRKEFKSLELYERKLIFPSIQSLFSESVEKTYSPNIPEIISLGQAKEERIKQQIVLLQDSMQLPTSSNDNNNSNEEVIIEKIISLFNINYFQAKEKWCNLLKELDPEKVSCKNREAGKCKCGKHLEDALKESETLTSDK